MTGDITVISGPTAVGKGTVVSLLSRSRPDVWVSVSATTRPPRPGEVHGVHYLFLTDEDFDRLVADDALLEWAVVHGRHRYGTPAAPVFQAVAAGRHAILEIDLQGARQVRARLPGARYVFVAPPTWSVLVDRLTGRGTETPRQMQQRLATARVEMAAAVEFDHVVVNDRLGETVSELVTLLGLPANPEKDDLEHSHS